MGNSFTHHREVIMKKALLFAAMLIVPLFATSCLDSTAADDYCNTADYCYADYQIDYYTYELRVRGDVYNFEYDNYHTCRNFTSHVYDIVPGCTYEFNRLLDCYSRLSCSELKYDTSYCRYEEDNFNDCLYYY